jgi:5-methylcytosine-specific restriction enzyme A
MPYRPPSTCPTPGCPTTTTGGPCPTHRTRYPRSPIYNTQRWRRMRKQVLREQPWCSHPGCNNPATDVDHIVPLPDGAAFDRANLQPLCKRHHSQKTQREVFGRKNG